MTAKALSTETPETGSLAERMLVSLAKRPLHISQQPKYVLPSTSTGICSRLNRVSLTMQTILGSTFSSGAPAAPAEPAATNPSPSKKTSSRLLGDRLLVRIFTPTCLRHAGPLRKSRITRCHTAPPQLQF